MTATTPAADDDSNCSNIADPTTLIKATDLHHGDRRPSSRPAPARPATAGTTLQTSSRPVPARPAPVTPLPAKEG